MPLRKGSKGIPGKNYKSFFGKPLFCWILDSAIKSKLPYEMWVATDCDMVKGILIEKYPQVKIFNRSIENALDASPTIDVVLEFLSSVTFNKQDNFILIQATSPLTSVENFLNLRDILEEGKKDSYIACTRMKRFRWSEEGFPLDYNLDAKPRRQEYNGFLIESGAFYASKIEAILTSKKLISGRIGVVELGSESSIDIDEPVDWLLGEAYLKFKSGGKFQGV